MTETTRAKSVKKPSDYQPADDDVITFKYSGVKVGVLADCLEDQEVISALRQGDLSGAVELIVTETKPSEVFDEIRKLDKRGRLMSGNFEGFMEALGEAVGAKNS